MVVARTTVAGAPQPPRTTGPAARRVAVAG